MIKLVKFIIWLVGLFVVSVFVLNYFGYEINRDYFNESKAACEEKFKECGNRLVRQGTDNAECNFNCVDPKIIIKKK